MQENIEEWIHRVIFFYKKLSGFNFRFELIAA